MEEIKKREITKQIPVSLKIGDLEKIEQYAKEKGISRSYLICQIVHNWCLKETP